MRQERFILFCILLVLILVPSYLITNHRGHSSQKRTVREKPIPLSAFAKNADAFPMHLLPKTIDGQEVAVEAAVTGVLEPQGLYVAVVQLLPNFPPANYEHYMWTAKVFGIAHGRPALLSTFHFNGFDERISNGQFSYKRGEYRSGDSGCCPHQVVRVSYSLTGRTLIQSDESVIKTLPNVATATEAPATPNSEESDAPSMSEDNSSNGYSGKIADLPEKGREVLEFVTSDQSGIDSIRDRVSMACGPDFTDYVGSDSFPGKIYVGNPQKLGQVKVSWIIPKCALDKTGEGFTFIISADSMHIRPQGTNAAVIFLF